MVPITVAKHRRCADMELNVSFYENVGHSPAQMLLAGALHDLQSRGLSWPRTYGPAWSDAALVASEVETGTIVGFLVYRHDASQESWFILLAYTHPAMRRRGVHTKLFETLVQRAKVRGDILSITAGTHPNNVAAQRAFDKQGRKLTGLMYEFKLRDFAQPKNPMEIGKDK